MYRQKAAQKKAPGVRTQGALLIIQLSKYYTKPASRINVLLRHHQ